MTVEHFLKSLSELLWTSYIMLRDGKRVGSFKSIKDAQFFLGMKSNGNISECLSGRRNNVFGYQFIYETPELLEADHDRV